MELKPARTNQNPETNGQNPEKGLAMVIAVMAIIALLMMAFRFI